MTKVDLFEDYINSLVDITINVKYQDVDMYHIKLYEHTVKFFTVDEFSNFIKDDRWNSIGYLWRVYSWQLAKQPPFEQKTSIIYDVIRSIMNFDKNKQYLNVLIKHSNGKVLHYLLNNYKGESFNLLIDRGLKSQNFSCRATATRFCDVKHLQKLLKDKGSNIRKIAAKRLGINNVAKELINDRCVELRLPAAIALNEKKVISNILRKEIDSYRRIKNKNSKAISYNKRYRIIHCLEYLDKTDLIFNLDATGIDKYIDKYIRQKIEGL